MREFWNCHKQRIGILALVTSLLLAGSAVPEWFAVTTSGSLKHRIFLLERNPGRAELKKGRYVLFELRARLINEGKPVRVIKEIGCDEGDSLTVVGRGYYCDGRYMGRAKDVSLKGEPVDNFVFNGNVPKGEVFLVGSHRDSYDSKYFGFWRKEDVAALAYPIF